MLKADTEVTEIETVDLEKQHAKAVENPSSPIPQPPQVDTGTSPVGERQRTPRYCGSVC